MDMVTLFSTAVIYQETLGDTVMIPSSRQLLLNVSPLVYHMTVKFLVSLQTCSLQSHKKKVVTFNGEELDRDLFLTSAFVSRPLRVQVIP